MSPLGAWRVVRTLIAGCLFAVPASAAGPDLYQRLEEMHHTSWTAKDGLLGRPVRLEQTADGYLWIGTSNGLVRFDGVSFERFPSEGGELPGVGVSALFGLPDGGLWVGYSRGGASWIPADGSAVHYSENDGLPIGTIRSFARDHDGVIWVAAIGGLARLEANRWQTVSSKTARADWNYPCRSAWTLFVDPDGTLWVGAASPNRILYLPKGARRFQDVGLEMSAMAFAQTGAGTMLFVDSSRRVIHGLSRTSSGAEYRGMILELPANRLALDGDGGLWLAGVDLHRLRLVGSTGVTPPGRASPLPEHFTGKDGLSGIPNDVLVDREGNGWVATNAGLDRFRRRNLTWKPFTALSSGASLVADGGGEVWVLSWQPPGLRRAPDGAPVPGAPENLDVGFLDPDGSVWLSTTRSFLRWSDGSFLPIPPPDELVARGYYYAVIAATWDRSGRLWASVNGLGQFYRQDARWTSVPILPDRPDWTATAAHTDAADRVWLAYRDELAVVEQGRVRLYTRADGLDIGPLLALGGRDGRIWVAGERGVAFQQDDRFYVVQTASRSFGAVSGLVVSRNGIWLSAAVGIVHIPEAEVRRLVGNPSHRVQFDLFDLESDLPEPLMVRTVGRNFAPVVEGRDGVLWFLTNGGLARVDPRQVVRNPVLPPVVIRSVTADDRPYSPRGPVSLPPLPRTLRIDYTALSLTIPERVRFRYRLEGWETEWHDAGTRRTVFYTDLRPGDYVFHVRACNNDEVWNDAGASLSFRVAPAWYETSWFKGLLALCLVAIVAALYTLRVRQVAAALSARFDERLAERTRIARELHDTLLQTVQGSKLVADEALDHPGDTDRTRRAMERLSEWLGRAVYEGRAAVNSLRASTVEANDLAESLRRAGDDPTKPSGLAVTVVVHGGSRDIHPIVRDEIYRIGYEAIRNAYAHSNAARLEVELEYGRDLRLRITDDGRGVDPAIADSGRRGRYGLPGMRERAANIRGTLEITGSPTGTTILLVVPGRSAFQSLPSPAH